MAIQRILNEKEDTLNRRRNVAKMAATLSRMNRQIGQHLDQIAMRLRQKRAIVGLNL